MNPTSSNDRPFVFVCGVPRSGTTLIQRMLNAHPDLTIANDTHFIPRALEKSGDPHLLRLAYQGEPIPLSEELVEQTWNYHRFRRLGIGRDRFERCVGDSESYQQLVGKLYLDLAVQHGSRFGGEKTPDYARRLRLLAAMFPTAKFIHLIRDGRDVALSLRDWATPTKGPGRLALWQRCPIGTAALWWSWMVLQAESQKAFLKADALLEIHYEQLVASPASELRRACHHLQLPFSNAMLDYHVGKARKSKKLSAKSAWLEPRKGLRNWNSDMDASESELFEFLAGPTLRLLGYATQHTTFSSNTKQTGRNCVEWWKAHFLARHADCSSDAQDTLRKSVSCT